MKKWALIVPLLGLCGPASAHHIWIVSGETKEDQAFVIFSDNLEPDRPELLKKIAHAECWLLDPARKDRAQRETRLTWERQDSVFVIEAAGTGPRRIGGSCVYGVETHDHRLRRDVEPYLLVYYPQGLLSTLEATAWDRLPLQITSHKSADGVDLQVLFAGKPVGGAELLMFAPGSRTHESHTVNEKGQLSIRTKTPGLYAFRTRHIEEKRGTHQGQDYRQVRHYASLTLRCK